MFLHCLTPTFAGHIVGGGVEGVVLKILKILQIDYYDGDLIRVSGNGTTGEGRIHTAHFRSENSW